MEQIKKDKLDVFTTPIQPTSKTDITDVKYIVIVSVITFWLSLATFFIASLFGIGGFIFGLVFNSYFLTQVGSIQGIIFAVIGCYYLFRYFFKKMTESNVLLKAFKISYIVSMVLFLVVLIIRGL